MCCLYKGVRVGNIDPPSDKGVRVGNIDPPADKGVRVGNIDPPADKVCGWETLILHQTKV